MNYQLIYSVAEDSTAPLSAGILGGALALIVLITMGVMYYRGSKFGPGIKFFSAAAILILVLSAGLEVEKRVIASKSLTEGRTAEGVISQHWTSYSLEGGKVKWLYEGFYVNGVHFSYTTNSDGNYFNNAGKHKIEMRDGMKVKVGYLEEKSSDRTRNHITRFELAD
jgi:hypothetical protein